jgi:hypothetical protein
MRESRCACLAERPEERRRGHRVVGEEQHVLGAPCERLGERPVRAGGEAAVALQPHHLREVAARVRDARCGVVGGAVVDDQQLVTCGRHRAGGAKAFERVVHVVIREHHPHGPPRHVWGTGVA